MTAVSSVYAQRLIMTLFLVSFGIYLFLATVTYTPFDPGWMHISSDTQQVSNASGVAGAWIADLLFGFLGWASLLIPIFLFVEAIQVWWPYSFLNKPFRYAAQFFILLATSSLLYLYWQVPADTLDNSSGGIIGYELGESLSQILTIYGATVFLVVFWFVLFTLAFGVKWNKTWATLKATPAYLQDLFYKNVPETESAFDRTAPEVKKSVASTQAKVAVENITAAPEHREVQIVSSMVRDQAAERLFDDMVEKEHHAQQQLIIDEEDEDEFNQVLEKAHRLEQKTQRVVPTGEVWRALNSDENQTHKQDIDALLRAAEESEQHTPNEHFKAVVHDEPVSTVASDIKQNLDWDDDEIFDELLAAVPSGKMATDVHTPFNPVAVEPAPSMTTEKIVLASSTIAASPLLHSTPKNTALDDDFDELDDLLVDDLLEADDREQVAPARTSSSYAQSSAFVRAEINTQPPQPLISEDEKALISSNKDVFREVWQETAGKPVEVVESAEDDFDLDAPLTDSMGRPMSLSMQVAQKRRDLPTLPGLELLDSVDPNKKVNFTAEQLARLSELLEIKLQEFNVKAKVIEAQPGPVVTRFELDLAPGVKASKVTNISRDLARSMSMASVRVVEVIPGKPYIGIEVPNSTREMVRLIELLTIPAFTDPNSILSMAMGKDISGNPVIADLGKAPHMLVAGTTGSGKSVAVNSMILSMLLKYTPDQLRLILIDPKQLELANYNDIPHLLTPVVTDMKDAVSALNWCVN
ncbi:MAG: DNA translocase FtsK 4TM domain-containing protein, partial [Acinetobacter sp.]